ncbi:hypothetical protein KG091_07750 [Carnobacteriaceae bacterium zg-ZUI78]|nr:hypothetical protein [Carnobacteriaceae bacterium zg-ZUI78]
MIELIVKEYLSLRLDVPSFFEREPHMPDKCIIIEKTSGSYKNKLKSATIAIQSYANTLYEAALLNENVKDVMDKIIELDTISGVHLNSDYNFTDTEMKLYRYQAVFDIFYY